MIKRDDVINLEITGSDAAKLYMILGRTNGPYSKMWSTVRNLFEPSEDHLKLRAFLAKNDVDGKELLRYNNYYSEWELLLFTPPKTEAELELEALESKMKELQVQMERVKLAIAN